MLSPIRFLWIWLACLLGFAAAVIGVNLLVDPYDVFGTPRIAGISALKPAAKNHAMLAKTYQVARAHPVTVLIGSSSVHIGIDASDPAWPEAMRPVYNYGIPGTLTSTSLETLREAIAVGKVKNAIVSLDFQNFLVRESPGGVSEEARRFHLTSDGISNPHRLRQTGSDMFFAAFTMGSLIDSVFTVMEQGRPVTLDLAANGSSTEAGFVNASRVDGTHALFEQKDIAELDRARGLVRATGGRAGPLANLDIVAQIIALAQAHDVKLTLLLAPHHADVLELYWRTGIWPRVEQLKTDLAALVASQGEGVVLWDFLEYSRYTDEAVPPDADRQARTRWFWEPNHYKKQLGRIMTERMFGTTPEEFGSVLNPETVAAHNREIGGRRNAVVCDGGAGLLTALPSPPPDGCDAIPLPPGSG